LCIASGHEITPLRDMTKQMALCQWASKPRAAFRSTFTLSGRDGKWTKPPDGATDFSKPKS
jgi:hypothetical protein